MGISTEKIASLKASLQNIDNCPFFSEGIIQCITSNEEYEEMMNYINENEGKKIAAQFYLEKAMDIYYGKDVWREWLSE